MIIRINNNNNWTALIFSFIIFLSLLDSLIPGSRYVKYLLLPFCLFLIVVKGQHYVGIRKYVYPFIGYIFFGICYFLIGQSGSVEDAIGDIFFIATYTVPFIFWRQKIQLKNVFLVAFIVFLIISIAKINTNIIFNPLNSKSTFEHSEFGFIFGVFSVYFITRKNYKYALLALFLTLISLKRIALVGVFFAIIVFYTKDIWYKKNLYVALIFGIVNISFILVLRFLSSEEFNLFSLKLFDLSGNNVLMGRVVLYDYIFDHSEINWLYGQGPGSIYRFASSAFETSSKVLIHSDILKMSFEFGLLFCFSFFFLLYYASKKWIEYLVFLNVIMISDNPLIYVSVMFLIFLIIENNESLNLPILRSRAS